MQVRPLRGDPYVIELQESVCWDRAGEKPKGQAHANFVSVVLGCLTLHSALGNPIPSAQRHQRQDGHTGEPAPPSAPRSGDDGQRAAPRLRHHPNKLHRSCCSASPAPSESTPASARRQHSGTTPPRHPPRSTIDPIRTRGERTAPQRSGCRSLEPSTTEHFSHPHRRPGPSICRRRHTKQQ